MNQQFLICETLLGLCTIFLWACQSVSCVDTMYVTSFHKAYTLVEWWTQHCFYNEKQLVIMAQRNWLSLQEKIEMLDKHPHSNQSELAKLFKIYRSTLTVLIYKEEELRQNFTYSASRATLPNRHSVMKPTDCWINVPI